MIPEQIRGRARAEVPVWALAAGVIALIILIFLAWIGYGMYHTPEPVPVTRDVPLAR